MPSQPTEKDVSPRSTLSDPVRFVPDDANSDARNQQTKQMNMAGTRVDSAASAIELPVADAYSLLREATEPVVIGDYEVQNKLGQGGMGAVYKARQLNLDREVALKVLARHLVDDQKFVHRFKREAKVMARLDHPNIIRCHDVGEINGLHYLAMEFVDGGSLQDLLDKHGKFTVGDALLVATAVAEALQYAHGLNLVHRDIKPDNILISQKGQVKVADLGLAKPVNDDLSMTASGVGAGTPHYMAPEQMRSAKEVDSRADIYALGAMLYVMLAGKKPHDGESLVKLLEQKEKGRAEPIRKLNPSVPDKLDLMIEKMMDRSLKTRYQTCAEVLQDLGKLKLTGSYLTVLFPDGPPPGVSSKATVDLPKAKPPGAAAIAAPVAVEAAPTARRRSDLTAGEFWYIQIGTTEDGRRRVKKLTQAQIKAQIKANKINSTTEASRNAGTGYQAIILYPEFELYFRSKLAEKRAERRAAKMQDKFAQIAAEVETYERKKWWGRFFNSLGGWAALVVFVAGLAGVVWLIIVYGPAFVSFIARKLGIFS